MSLVEKTVDEVQDGKWNIVVHQPPEAMVRPQADTIHGVYEPILMAVEIAGSQAESGGQTRAEIFERGVCAMFLEHRSGTAKKSVSGEILFVRSFKSGYLQYLHLHLRRSFDWWWIFLEMFFLIFLAVYSWIHSQKTRKVNGFNKAHREEEDGIEGEEPDVVGSWGGLVLPDDKGTDHCILSGWGSSQQLEKIRHSGQGICATWPYHHALFMACQAAILKYWVVQGSRSQHPLSGDWRRGDWCFVKDIESNFSLELLEEILDHFQFDCKFTQILGSPHVKPTRFLKQNWFFRRPRGEEIWLRGLFRRQDCSDFAKFNKMLS